MKNYVRNPTKVHIVDCTFPCGIRVVDAREGRGTLLRANRLTHVQFEVSFSVVIVFEYMRISIHRYD